MAEIPETDRVLSELVSEVATLWGLPVDQVETNVTVVDSGINSLGLIKLLLQIERRFSVSFTPTEVGSLFEQNLIGLARVVAKKLG